MSETSESEFETEMSLATASVAILLCIILASAVYYTPKFYTIAFTAFVASVIISDYVPFFKHVAIAVVGFVIFYASTH